MFLIGKEAANVLLTTWPAIGALPLIKIVYKITRVIFDILFHPILAVFVLAPTVHAKEVGPLPIAFVALPLTDIQPALPIPKRTATGANSHVPVAHINGFRNKGNRHLQPAVAMKLAVFKVAIILALTPSVGEL